MTTTAQNIVDALLLGFQHLEHPAVKATYDRLLRQIEQHYKPAEGAAFNEKLRHEVVNQALIAFRTNPLTYANRLVNELHDIGEDDNIRKAVIELMEAVEHAVLTPRAPGTIQTPTSPSPGAAQPSQAPPPPPSPAPSAPTAPSVGQAPPPSQAPRAPQAPPSDVPPSRSRRRGLGGLFSRTPRPEKKEEKQPDRREESSQRQESARSDSDSAERTWPKKMEGQSPEPPGIPTPQPPEIPTPQPPTIPDPSPPTTPTPDIPAIPDPSPPTIPDPQPPTIPQPEPPEPPAPAPTPGGPPSPDETGAYSLDWLDEFSSDVDTEVLTPDADADELVEEEAAQPFMPGAPVLEEVSSEQVSEAQFSAYYPPQVKPGVSYGLYVYAHTPDALQAIRENVERFKERLGGDVPDATTAAQHAMLRLGTELTAVPQADHVKFTPAQQVRTWVGDWTRFDFDFTPEASVSGTLDVRVSIQVAGIEIAHIPCQMQVNAAEAVPVRSINPLLDARLRAVTARMYNRIFISYSRRDLPVANAYRLAQQAAGNDVFMDSYSIRAGEDWQAALARAIDEADVFQLFWSRNSADSPNVRDEYTYALHQRCPNDRCVTFIRPVFWEEPLVPPPNELGHLNFRFVALPDDVREATPQTADSETTLVRLASMESRLSAIEASLEAIKQAVLGLANPKQ